MGHQRSPPMDCEVTLQPRRPHALREQLDERVTLSVEIEYAGIDPFRRMLGAHEAEVIAEEFSVTAGYRVRLPTTRVEGFRAALLDATSGDALIELLP